MQNFGTKTLETMARSNFLYLYYRRVIRFSVKYDVRFQDRSFDFELLFDFKLLLEIELPFDPELLAQVELLFYLELQLELESLSLI